jgi:arylsulfatase A-like enzyme
MKIQAKAIVLLFAFGALAAPVACGRKREVCRDLPASIVWEKDQSRIHPGTGTMNVWEGWAVKDDHFEAGKNRSSFVFWRTRGGPLRLQVTYSLTPHDCILVCNGTKAVLPPAAVFSKIAFEFEVRKGFNFLETSKKTGDTLRIREVRIGDPAGDDHLLREGEQWVEYFPPGEGSILFNGKGSLVIEKAQTREGEIGSESRRLDTSRSRRDLRYDFRFSRIGYLKISAEKGTFDILRHEFREDRARPLPAVPVTGKRPDVFIFLIDGCQAKHLSTYGYRRKTSPAIDELARDSVVFENAYANATITQSSVATILSGLYPERHNLMIQRNRLPGSVTLLPEFMKSLGYRTALFSASYQVTPAQGFRQGVDDFVPNYLNAKPDVPNESDTGSAPPIAKDFFRWLDGPGPRFAYLHFMEPHWPLLPPAPFLNMFKGPPSGRVPAGLYGRLRDLENSGHRFSGEEAEDARADYDSDIAYIDHQLGKIWRWMRDHDLYDESVIILLADHGEAFFEHGQVWSHGVNVFDETTHVPLIFKLPKSLNRKGRVPSLVQLVDVFPTIAGLFGKTPECDGRDALRLPDQGPMDDTFAVSRTAWYFTGESPATYSMRWRNWYYILNTKTGRAQLYRLDGDPLRDVLPLNPRIVTLFGARFLSWYRSFEKLDVPLGPPRRRRMSDKEVEALKSLGYL